jgi:hypothetical protein
MTVAHQEKPMTAIVAISLTITVAAFLTNRFIMMAIMLIITALALGQAGARTLYAGQYDDVDPATRSWFKGVRSPRGVPCCDIADGHRTTWRGDGDGHYWVPIEGEWRLVPPEAVINNAANPVGEAVVWYVRQGPDAIYIRCFVPSGGV